MLNRLEKEHSFLGFSLFSHIFSSKFSTNFDIKYDEDICTSRLVDFFLGVLNSESSEKQSGNNICQSDVSIFYR